MDKSEETEIGEVGECREDNGIETIRELEETDRSEKQFVVPCPHGADVIETKDSGMDTIRDEEG